MKTFDFYADLKEIIHKEYEIYGVRIPIRNDLRDMLFDYFTVHYKVVPPISREVLLTSEIKTKIQTRYNHEIASLIEKLKFGEDINSYQSSRLKETKFHDHMRNSWNIFHFHFDPQPKVRKKKANRTDEMLFVYTDEEQAIVLDTDTHSKNIFAHEKWLTMLDNNFPEILNPFLSKNVTDYFPKLNATQRQTLWNKGYTVAMIKINDKIIIDPGIGRSCSGHGMQVVESAMSVMHWLDKTSEDFKVYHKKICLFLNCDPDRTRFMLRSGNRTFNVIVKHSGLNVLAYPETVDLNKISINSN